MDGGDWIASYRGYLRAIFGSIYSNRKSIEDMGDGSAELHAQHIDPRFVSI